MQSTIFARAGLAGLSVILSLALLACDRTQPIIASEDGPTIESLSAVPMVAYVGDIVTITAVAESQFESPLTYRWSAAVGDLIGSGSEVNYIAESCCVGNNDISVRVTDAEGRSSTATITVIIRFR